MNGILLVDKPEGWTSHDVVGKLRSLTHERRIGHSGTLDPMATGLLVVFIGRATRAVEFAEADKKRYTAGLRLGVSTDTQDTSGSVTAEREVRVSDSELKAVLDSFRGELMQLPPMYSAVKVGGKKLYELARKGETVERKPRRITVFELSSQRRSDTEYSLEVVCSKGTYIRTLCNDIGEALGCGGCMSSLRRTEAGAFSVNDAHTVDALIAAAECGELESLLLPIDTLFSQYPMLRADAHEEKRLRCGNIIKTSAAEGVYRVYSEAGELLLLGEAKNGELRTIKNFFEV